MKNKAKTNPNKAKTKPNKPNFSPKTRVHFANKPKTKPNFPTWSFSEVSIYTFTQNLLTVYGFWGTFQRLAAVCAAAYYRSLSFGGRLCLTS